MDIYTLKDLSESDRKSVFESEAIATEELVYTKVLTPEELTMKKDEFTQQAMLQSIILDEFKEVKANFKFRLDPIADQIKELLSCIKTKSLTIHGRVYKIADYENAMIHMVDPLGNVISSRRMLPEERQFRIQTSKAI